MTRKPVKTTGKTRMKELGCKVVEVWLDARELALVQAAADDEGKRLATYLREKAFHAAQGHALGKARAAQEDANGL
jgi:hypothetical protein